MSAGETAAIVTDALVLGGNVFGWTADEDASVAVLDAFFESGGRMIDTADVYSSWVPGNHGGESEKIIGRWVSSRRNRDQVQIATKVGQHAEASGLSRASIRRGVEASLRRLNTDRIDVYYAHFDDPDAPLEETLEAFDELVREGKVLHLAASNYTAARLGEALSVSAVHGWASFEVFQAHYNLVRREAFERDFAPLLAEHGVEVLTYYSLAQGFLSGKYRSPQDGGGVRAKPALRYLDDRGLRVLDALDELAEKYDVAPAAVALAWLRSRALVAAPVASATSPAQLAELLAVRELSLDEADLVRLTAASDPAPVGGAPDRSTP